MACKNNSICPGFGAFDDRVLCNGKPNGNTFKKKCDDDPNPPTRLQTIPQRTGMQKTMAYAQGLVLFMTEYCAAANPTVTRSKMRRRPKPTQAIANHAATPWHAKTIAYAQGLVILMTEYCATVNPIVRHSKMRRRTKPEESQCIGLLFAYC